MQRIGITTTLPIEVLLAAGYQPVDLNNLFISAPNPEKLVSLAERDGFPLNCCTWIKGIYGTCKEYGIRHVVCVTTGDCSNTIMLMEVFKHKHFRVIPFAYPAQPDSAQMLQTIKDFAERLGTTLSEAEKIKKLILSTRRAILDLDEMTWKDGLVSGYENHIWQVCASDFNGEYQKYESDVRELIKATQSRTPYPDTWLRLGYIGVPPVFARDLYDYLESNESRVIFNEIQHQFVMPRPGKSIANQYTNYTYPYSIRGRLQDIRGEIKRRNLQGVIHYVQAFCHRGIGDIIFRESLDVPILTIEGNQDFYLTQHLKTRIEAFLDMMRRGCYKKS